MIKPKLTAAILAPLGILLGACGETTGVDDVQPQPAELEPFAPPVTPIVLEPIDAESLGETDLEGELGCSFSRTEGGAPLLVGYAFVAEEGGDAAIRIDGEIVPLSMTGVGGFSRMSDGATFVGEGLMATITVTGTDPLGEGPEVAQESPAFAANLAVSRLEEEVVIEGFYECGP